MGRTPHDWSGKQIGRSKVTRRLDEKSGTSYRWGLKCACGTVFQRLSHQVLQSDGGCHLCVCRQRVKTSINLKEIVQRRDNGETMQAIATRFGVSRQAVSAMLIRYRKRHSRWSVFITPTEATP